MLASVLTALRVQDYFQCTKWGCESKFLHKALITIINSLLVFNMCWHWTVVALHHYTTPGQTTLLKSLCPGCCRGWASEQDQDALHGCTEWPLTCLALIITCKFSIPEQNSARHTQCLRQLIFLPITSPDIHWF